MEESQIQKEFVGATVLLTGGTGFVGKLLIDKLLRTCGIKELYLLIRPKKNKDPKSRLQEQFNDVLYDRLRKEIPNFLNKVHLVEGQISEENLGISEEDRQTFVNDVNFIFHGAATVRFDEPLKQAVLVNVRGTREMLKLARSCTQLRSFVYISTAYSNCIHTHIEEDFYKMSLDGEKLIDLVESMDEETLKGITAGLLGKYPNTYAYTKAAAEDVLLTNRKGLPIAVFRPAIVVSTAKEPISGWIDNIYGPTGVTVGSWVGLLRVLHCNPKTIGEMVPGDMAVNACIAVAWKTARDFSGNQQSPENSDQMPRIYNFASSENNRINWGDYIVYNINYGKLVPLLKSIWYHIVILEESPLLFKIYSLFLHWIPAYIMDAVAVVIGKKPIMRDEYRKIDKFSNVLSYFTCVDISFTQRNTLGLLNQLCDVDKGLFNFDMNAIDWDKYFSDHILGVRTYIFKENLDNIPEAKKWYFKLKILHYTVIFIVCGLVLLFLKFLLVSAWDIFL